jgi:hypothetical protein
MMDVHVVHSYLQPQNSTNLGSLSPVEPVMHAFSSLLLLGTFVFQSVLGRPDGTRVRREGEILKRSVDSFVATESPIALSRLLCNIGSSGCAVSGAASGVVVASPSKNNPDCKFHDHPESRQTTDTFWQTGIHGLGTVLLCSRPSSTPSPIATVRICKSRFRTTLLPKPSFRESPTLPARSRTPPV